AGTPGYSVGSPRCVSSPTDHYRSFQTGIWSDITTWESSPDYSTWSPATLIPTSLANTITIQSPHTVTVSANASADQLIVSAGATLEHSGGIFTIEDGIGDDMDILATGVLLLSTTAISPSFGAGNAVINVRGNGMVRVSAASLTGFGTGVNANNYDYEHQSILEYTLSTPFSTANVTYFPNATSGVIPILRTTQAIGLPMGAGTNTTINGVYECNGNISLELAGTKTFRNGIRGTGTITALGTSGTFIINGVTAELGGTGGLVVPASGLQIGATTTVTMSSNKTVTGNISLLADTYIDLGANNLTVTGTMSNATVTSYVRTLGSGKLTLNNVSTGAGGKLFPIGRTTINPLFIQSTTTANYSARIVEPITPPIANSNYAVLRTWYITSSAASPSAFISFGYTPATDCGPSYINAGPVEIGVYAGVAWNIQQSGLTPAAFPIVPGTFAVTNTNPINTFTAGGEFPFVIANNGAILPLDYFVVARAQKINNSGIIRWDIVDADNVRSFEVQRSLSGSGFQTIAMVNPVVHQLNYNYSDASLQAGTILYRIKVNRMSGGERYSNTVAIINDNKGLLITSMTPNPVHTHTAITLSTAKAGRVNFEIFNISGQRVKTWTSVVAEGTNIIKVSLNDMPAGVYHLLASAMDTKTVLRFVKQ
ncbi:MAG TPA: T9SS type A sorting domain-containing protein, partial [Chitinophagaceae bacterium]|nr:T9SS type A sorting domain-containing protein [Chitinophagaceae bacterium]